MTSSSAVVPSPDERAQASIQLLRVELAQLIVSCAEACRLGNDQLCEEFRQRITILSQEIQEMDAAMQLVAAYLSPRR